MRRRCRRVLSTALLSRGLSLFAGMYQAATDEAGRSTINKQQAQQGCCPGHRIACPEGTARGTDTVHACDCHGASDGAAAVPPTNMHAATFSERRE